MARIIVAGVCIVFGVWSLLGFTMVVDNGFMREIAVSLRGAIGFYPARFICIVLFALMSFIPLSVAFAIIIDRIQNGRSS